MIWQQKIDLKPLEARINALESAQQQGMLSAMPGKISALENSIAQLKSTIESQKNSTSHAEISALKADLDSLKLWKADIMLKLTEENPVTGKKKLSKMARHLQTFYGK